MIRNATQIIAAEILLGTDDAHLIFSEKLNGYFHPEIIAPLYELVDAAKRAGFCLKIASSYRSFERQLLIWNNKANGIRPVLDANGCAINMDCLTDYEKLFAILRWSALPGASRHHWGTDIDVYDSANITADYTVQLTVEETQGDGPFAKFHEWLTNELRENSRDFFRPYRAGIGSIAPEPWHLSYAPVANNYCAQLTPMMLREKIQSTDIELKQTILHNLDEIYQRYVKPYC